MKKRECKKETVEMNIDKLSNVKSTLNERNKRIRILQIKGMIIALLVIALAIVTVIGVRNPKAELKAFETQELSVVKQYEELDESEDVLEETQDVQFSAFFLRDIDNDEELEKIKGTCKRIGEEDILYMDLKLNGGQLKDAKIEIDSKNFFIQTALSKDEIIKNDYYSNNITQIELNDLNNNAQKLIIGKIRSGNYENLDEIASALNQNINNYSRKDNKIIFTAKYIKDGKEIDIRKEINLSVDWYLDLASEEDKDLKTNCDVVQKVIKDTNKVCYEISVDTKEIKSNGLLKNNKITGQIPQADSKNPTSVKIDSEDVEFIYDEKTRNFEIIEETEIKDNGEIVSVVPETSTYTIEVEYEDKVSETEDIKVEAKQEVYNNDNSGFENPVKVASAVNVKETVGVAEEQVDLNYVIWYIQNDNYPTQENVVRVEYSSSSLEPPYIPVNEGDINITDWYNNLAFYRINVDGGYIQDGVEYETFSELIDFIPDQIKTGSIVSVFYETPKTVQYNVEYYKEGAFVESELVSKKVAKSETGPFKINISDFNSSKYKGYKLDTTSVPTSVVEGGTVKLNYVIDESQTKNLNYVIWYCKNGNMPGTSDVVQVKKTVHVLESDYIPVNEGDINITDRFSGYAFYRINVDGGYKQDGVEYPTTGKDINFVPEGILTGSIIIVNYETPKIVTYTSEVYKGTTKFSTGQVSVRVAQSETGPVKVDKSLYSVNKFEGYKLVASSVPDTIEIGGTVKAVYEIDLSQTKTLTYVIWYMNNGAYPGTSDVVHKNLTVQKLESNYIPVNEGDINTTNWFSGRMFSKINIDGGYIKDGIEYTVLGEDIDFIPDAILTGSIVEVHFESPRTISYNVEYYKGGVLQTADTQTVSEVVPLLSHNGYLTVDKSKINLVDKYYGYKTTTTIPDTVASGTTIKVYYEVDPSQTKDVTATVYFIKDDVVVEEIDVKQTVQVLIDTVDLTKENIVIENRYDGYKFDGIDTSVGAIDGSGSQDPKWLTYWPDKVYDGSYLEVNYVKRNDLVYTVEYYFDGVIDSSLTETINNQTYGSQVSAYTDKVKTGYTLDVVEPITIGTGENVLKVYYVTDETQTKEMTYTVEFYKNGVLSSADTISKVKTVQVLENYIEVDKEEINIVDKYYGYKYDYIMVYFGIGVARAPEPTPEKWDTIPDEVTEGTYLRVYYVTDETQTKELSYTVEYYKDNVLVTEDTQVVKNTVQVLKSDVMYVDESQINVEDKYLGYKFSELKKVQKTRVPEPEGTENNPIIPDVVNSGTTIQVYYTARTDLSYTVNYLEQDTNKVLYTSKVVNNQTYLSLVTETARSIYGYDFVNETETIEITTGDNVINFYYTAKNTFYYVINYRDKATDRIVESSKVVKNVTYGQTYIEEYIDVEGYNPDGDQIEITVTSNGLQYDLYYTARSDLSYTVEYYFNRIKDDSLTEIYNNQTYGTQASIYTDKVKTGYKFNYDNTPINIGLSNNVIKVYYTIDDTQTKELSYTLNFYKDDFDEPVETLVFTEIVHVLDEDILAVDKNVEIENRYIGYYFNEIMADMAEVATYGLAIQLDELPTEVYDGAVLEVFYNKRTDLSYVVNYLEEGTNRSLADSKLVDNQTYLDEVTENAIDIFGYNKVNPTETIIIDVENNTINFYYTTRKDFKYTINYLDRETGELIAESKVVNNAIYGTTYIEDAIDIDGYNKAENIEVVVDEDNKEYNLYYEKRTDLSYTVEHYYDGIHNSEEDIIVENQTYKTVIDSWNESPARGYKFDRVRGLPLEIGTGMNIIKIYYVTDPSQTKDLRYRVEYYKDGMLEDVITEIQTVQYLDPDIMTVYADKINTNDMYDGYYFDSTEPEIIPDTLRDNDIIRVYYKARTDLDYRVEYYYNEVLDESETEWYFGQTFGTQIDTYTDKRKIGYKLKNDPEPIIIGTGENVLKVYYVTDETQTKELSYTLKFYKDGQEIVEDRIYRTKEVQMLETDIIEFVETIDMENKYEGYFYDGTKILANYLTFTSGDVYVEYMGIMPDEVRSGAVLHAYYSRLTNLEYKVEYYYNGVLDETATETIKNQTFEDVVNSYPDKVKPGYKLEKEPDPITIGVENNVLKVYYVADESQTKEVSYTVEYYKDGVHLPDDDQVVVEVVQYLEPEYLEVNVEEININNKYTGYRFNRIETEGIDKRIPIDGNEIPVEANNGGKIKVYYVKDSFEYRVEYYYNGVKDDSKTEYKTALYETQVSTYTDKVETGYRLEKTPDPIIIGTSENVLKVYYVIDDNQTKTLSYTLEFFKDYNLVHEDTMTITKTVQVLDDDIIEVDKENIEIENKYIGYYFSHIDTSTFDIATYVGGSTQITLNELPTEVYNNALLNVMYFRRTDLSYVVNYLEEGTNRSLADSKLVDNQTYLDEVTENAIDIFGYNKVNPTETIIIDVENNTINFYYTTRKDFKYTINYIDRATGELIKESKVVNNAIYGTTYREEAIDIDGYYFVEDPEVVFEVKEDNKEYSLYYEKRTDLSYKTEYYYNGYHDPSRDTVVNGQTFKTVIDSYVDRPEDGYIFEKVEGLPLTIGTGENIIRVYYAVDDKQTKEISYTVEYYKDGVKVDEEIERTTVQLLAPDIMTVNKDKINVQDKYEGYYFDSTEPNVIPDTIANKGVIKVNYIIRNDLNYVVNYLEEGTNTQLANSKIVDGKTYQSDVTETAIDIFGYRKVNEQETIRINIENNIINFYYTKRNDFVYKIHYTEFGTDKMLAESKVINNLTYGDRFVETAIEIEGYKVDSLKTTLTVDQEIKNYTFTYTKRNDLSYSVEYYYNGVLDPTLTDVFENQTYNSEITNYVDKIKTGYKFEKASLTTIGVGENVVKIYYVADEEQTKELSYTVEYYKDGVKVDEDVERMTVQLLASDIMTVNKDKINIQDKYEGYYFDSTEPNVIPDIVTDGDIIKVNYTIRTDLGYRVEYYFNNEIDESLTDQFAGQTYDSEITTYVDKVKAGYKFDYATTPIRIGVGENVIKVYYVTDEAQTKELSYTVEYYKDGVKVDEEVEKMQASADALKAVISQIEI